MANCHVERIFWHGVSVAVDMGQSHPSWWLNTRTHIRLLLATLATHRRIQIIFRSLIDPDNVSELSTSKPHVWRGKNNMWTEAHRIPPLLQTLTLPNISIKALANTATCTTKPRQALSAERIPNVWYDKTYCLLFLSASPCIKADV